MRKLTAATVAAVAALSLAGAGAAFAATGHPGHVKTEAASSRDRHADRSSRERTSRDRPHAEHSTDRSTDR